MASPSSLSTSSARLAAYQVTPRPASSLVRDALTALVGFVAIAAMTYLISYAAAGSPFDSKN